MTALRAGALAAVLAITLAGAGCGGGALAPSTAPVAEGTEVTSQRYLTDVDAAAAAIREFSDRLEAIGPVARPAQLRAVAPELAAALQRANAIAGRIEAQRLADARIEAQRAAASPLLGEVVSAMADVTTRAAAGEAAPTVSAIEEFREAVDRLRALGGAAPASG
jgi:high-affinity K+ transport system ATPase subunit B